MMAIVLLGALLIGVAHLHPALFACAWLGVALETFGLGGIPARNSKILSIVLSALLSYGIALAWMIPCATGALHWSFAQAFAIYALVVTIATGVSRLPFCLLLLARPNVPVRWLLPLSWVLGEALLERAFSFSLADLLYSQSQVQVVLRSLALFGWYPTLLVMLTAAAFLGDSLQRGRRSGLLAFSALLALLFILPSASADTARLEGLGAVHMPNIAGRPAAIPSSVDVLIWPEASSAQRPRLEEGQHASNVHIEGLATGKHHLVGLEARTHAGLINAVLHVDRAGVVQHVRGKSTLVPGYERSFLGLRFGSGELTAGSEPPLFEVDGRGFIPIICYEVFHRPTIQLGLDHGGEVLALLASDRLLAPSEVARRQLFAALVLRAVEFHLPAVRASLWGNAALVAADGQVLELSQLGESGVLSFERTALALGSSN